MLRSPCKADPRRIGNDCERDVGPFTFFYKKHSPLSNMYKAPFTDYNTGQLFTSVEQYYQYQKALICQDPSRALMIQVEDDPHVIKVISKGIANYDEERWRACYATKVMETAIWMKFQQNPQLARHLIATNPVLVEANPHHNFFGIVMGMYDPDVLEPSQWRGANLQGQILMWVKRHFKECTTL